jgi:hypothetical protein
MLLHRSTRLPPFVCRASFREARWPHAVAGALLGTFSVGCLALGRAAQTLEHGPLARLGLGVGLAGGLLCGLGALLSVHNLSAALRPDNWLVRYGPEGLLIRFRSYQDAHVPERGPTVASVAASEISRVVLRTRARAGTAEGAEPRGRGVFLDVHLARGDATALAEAIARDQAAVPPARLGLRWRTRHVPVWVPERGVIRLAWRDAASRVTPSAWHALARMGATLTVEHERPPAPGRLDDRAAELAGQLRRMCEEGDTIGALSLARARYDLSHRDARAFLERLAGSH